MILKVIQSFLDKSPFVDVDYDSLSRSSLRGEELQVKVDSGVVLEDKDLFHVSLSLATLSLIIIFKTVKESILVLEWLGLREKILDAFKAREKICPLFALELEAVIVGVFDSEDLLISLFYCKL